MIGIAGTAIATETARTAGTASGTSAGKTDARSCPVCRARPLACRAARMNQAREIAANLPAHAARLITSVFSRPFLNPLSY